eukprot:TRINITY_DN11128_c2_g1_i1.p2 TRINITY_DN11128_c2_g1~~TRINITY_DN11128_c2_g1_i1.p2  ORF type:complete len:182 (+),score=35.51 TRINITY_DN11128_c2_g1_i1:61-606(+)
MAPADQPEPGPWTVGGSLVDFKTLSWSEIAAWRNPTCSGLVLGSAVLWWYLAEWRQMGNCALAAYVLLTQICVSWCFRLVRGKDHHTQTAQHWDGEVDRAIGKLSAAVSTKLGALSRLCGFRSGRKAALACAVCALVLGELGKCCGFVCVLMLMVIAAFSTPLWRAPAEQAAAKLRPLLRD